MHLPRSHSGWTKLGLIAAAILAAYLVLRGFVPEVDLQALLEDFSRTLGEWTYLIVSVFAFLETGAFVGLVVPGETVVVLGGAVAGQGETELLLTIALVWGSAFLGDTASFFIGAKLGRGFVLRHGERLRISRERFARVESYFERHGGKTILIGRFIGIIRALAPFVAGSSGMRYLVMAPYSILGTGLWAATFTLLGYFASQNVEAVVHASERGLLYFALLVGAIVGAIVLIRWLRVADNRHRAVVFMEERRGLRSLLAGGRRLAPQARFVWARITPGGLGLEFTAAIAVLAVGGYTLVAYGVILDHTSGPTITDRSVETIVDQIRAGWLTSIAKPVSWLGSPLVVIAVTAVAAIGFGWRRHWAELGVVVAAVGLMMLTVPEVKELVGRPRPAGGLVDAGGNSYPSGHAAHSVLYAWLALTVTLRLRPRLEGGTALIVGGILLAGAIGLSRVYLGVHYMSDVTGGWALGVSAFSLCAAVAIVVTHMRQNGPDGA
jgi:membrane protein DedA with SNARE-associated domain/membrane-associated phospholipid phosphatase